ncbi:hypothetical protein AZF37_06625 [endosymbiont 'TC1' of Trimyema compressum]|uniref:cardiolipin synthase n=1 Tax=endosymbiont 'TC1' of Trimyema compressum TaxID=243899 RepID=UPI0007F08B87|nr:cardiolipin synthase [endosymbiont 'TC1' of Trimyema compressum]AMP20880.1 hypothetical protein AZF37_06625 [endosymbiont 'TC1' of Trimyema compressum]
MGVILTVSGILILLYGLWIAAFVFLQRRDPASTTAWLLIFVALPGIGFIVYYFFGRDLSKKKVFHFEDSEKKLIIKIANQKRTEKKCKIRCEIEDQREIIRLIGQLDKLPISYDNEVDFYMNGHDKFKAFMEDIENAKEEVNVMYFIYKRGILGESFRDLLIKKAKEGVKVRLLLDDLGARKVKGNYFKELIATGGKVSFSFPVTSIYIRVNNRNHRKIAIIDRKYAYIGGYNIGDEYLGMKKKMGYWRDTHVRIQGTSVQALLVRFILDWRHAGNNDMAIDYDVFRDPENQGEIGAQVLSSGPDSKLAQIKLAYMEIISHAKEYIYIQSPYFVPDAPFLEAMKIALLKGVDIHIMIPNKQDHIFVYWATYSFIGDLLPLGLKAYTYNNGFLHSKTIMADGKVGSVGSANFDERSFNLSFETNVFLYGNKVGKAFKDIFEEDLKHCTQITMEMYNNRSIMVRIKEPISRLISPVL